MIIDVSEELTMRVLYCTHTSEGYVGCATLSDEQVVCGPNWPTKRFANGYTHIQTPPGRFDMQVVVNMLPAHQKPDMIVVWADSSCVVQPYNLGAFSGPKVLLIADTHHMDRPLEKVIAYAKSEPWDFLVAFDNRHHLHFFHEAGLKNIYWIPGLNSLSVPMEFNIERSKKMTFVGQSGKFHPRRKEILSRLQAVNFPVDILQVPGTEALKAYSKSFMSLECTLNSNIGLRTFEVLSAGGLLLADRPSVRSGMDLLFKDGKHLVYYDNFNDLLEKASYYLKNPQELFPIALAGYQEFWENHSPKKKSQELMDLVWKGIVNPKYDLMLESRMRRNLAQSSKSFTKRVKAYQHIQELHRNQENVNILYYADSNCDLVEDILDLPRVRCGVIPESIGPKTESDLKNVIPQKKQFGIAGDNWQSQQWDAVIIPPEKKQWLEGIKGSSFNYRHLVINDDFQAEGIVSGELPKIIETDNQGKITNEQSKRLFYKFGEQSSIGADCEISSSQGISIGNNVMIQRKCCLLLPFKNFNGIPRLIIDDGCDIGRSCTISVSNNITIEKNVTIAPNVFIADYNQQYENVAIPIMYQGTDRINKQVLIGEGSLIGSNSVIVGNIIIGKGCIIEANSVVTSNIPDFCIAVGNPARVVKCLDRKSIS